MSTTLSACARLLTEARVRHHVDVHDAAIRLVFLTRHYENPRGEKLAVVGIETPDDGHRLRVSIVRAFAANGNQAAACLALCRLAAETPLVGVEYDADGDGIRLVAETPIEDGRVTKRQLLAIIDAVVEAAETWHTALRAPRVRAGSGKSVA